MLIFLLLQILLLLLLFVHDWFPFFPFIDLTSRIKHESLSKRVVQGIINTLFIGIAIVLTCMYFSTTFPPEVIQYIIIMYGTFFVGEVYSWWLPYFFGFPYHQTRMLKNEYQETLKILPNIKKHPTPDVMHMILHLLTLLCFIIACKLFL